jgi:hypothetical protein
MRNDESILASSSRRYWGPEAVLCPVHAISTKLATAGGGRDVSSLVAAAKVSIAYPFQRDFM